MWPNLTDQRSWLCSIAHNINNIHYSIITDVQRSCRQHVPTQINLLLLLRDNSMDFGKSTTIQLALATENKEFQLSTPYAYHTTFLMLQFSQSEASDCSKVTVVSGASFHNKVKTAIPVSPTVHQLDLLYMYFVYILTQPSKCILY